jgi:hypothetical protein
MKEHETKPLINNTPSDNGAADDPLTCSLF